MFNKNKFRAKVYERGQTLEKVADFIGKNPATITRKLNGESEFTRNEIQQLISFLNLSDEEVKDIFFAS